VTCGTKNQKIKDRIQRKRLMRKKKHLPHYKGVKTPLITPRKQRKKTKT